jgi:signal transduction histidine kinase
MSSRFFSLSLSRQFLLSSFPILFAGTLVIGWWIGRQVEASVLRRGGGVTALYVDSFIAPHAQRLRASPDLTDADRAALGALLTSTPLGQKIVSLKIWRPDGRVLFSSDGDGVGRSFAIGEGLAAALRGDITSELSHRSEAERREHGQPGLARVIETYTPIHADGLGTVIAAAEFYQAPHEVEREAAIAQRQSWLVVATTMLGMYLLLFIVVRRGNGTIARQQHDLGDKVQQLTALNLQNTQLHARVSRAAERAILLNETFLQRISADVHDGPGQDLSFALMQLKNMRDRFASGDAPQAACAAEDADRVRAAVQSALTDLRAISADLELPDIAQLSAAEIAARVVRDFHAKTRAEVRLDASAANDALASFRVKVTLYRLLQELLSNALRHAHGLGCRVHLGADGSRLTVEVSDDGPGFDLQTALAKERLGLHGMRQRVEVLRGTFDVTTAPGTGTRVRVSLPLGAHERQDDE